MTQAQIIRSLVYGLVFWFIAAMTVKLFAPFFDGGLANLAILVVSIPIAWASIPLGLAVTGSTNEHALNVNVVAIIIAAFADGIGITFASNLLYAGEGVASQRGAAWILWGVAWILLFAWQKARA